DDPAQRARLAGEPVRAGEDLPADGERDRHRDQDGADRDVHPLRAPGRGELAPHVHDVILDPGSTLACVASRSGFPKEPRVPATDAHSPRMAVRGIESELAVLVDGERAAPEALWGSPSALLGPAPLEAAGQAASLPGGGVVYFDEG